MGSSDGYTDGYIDGLALGIDEVTILYNLVVSYEQSKYVKIYV